ncbi:hypothetical protein [Micromonospora echinofusca]|uniref:Lipoprotein LpqN n=1 Tax=Micromonospora echinofusca TaxID=47858 RepID=A0ABS3VSK7_MICEH|nr:hypothetical protein [Micromonospora echinofusca]MBO4207501.1 hypothetical protein [Micromonospora echinofusca]
MPVRQPSVGRTRRIVLFPVMLATVAVLAAGCPAGSTEPPARATAGPTPSTLRLITPETLGGLPKSRDRGLLAPPTKTMGALKQMVPGVTSAVAWAYGGRSETEDTIAVSGVTGSIADPAGLVDWLFTQQTMVTDVRPVDPGPLGGEVRCGAAQKSGYHVTVCLWADRDSVGQLFVVSRSDRDRTGDIAGLRKELVAPPG